MFIGGFQKSSLIDFPGKISAVVFTIGCNFRCGYCHNPELLSVKTAVKISEQEIFDFFKKRKGKLDGIVVTGGEPTLQNDLGSFIEKIKHNGYLVKLDTNGSRPEVLEKLLRKKLLDYIAMDIKAPFQKYQKVVKRKVDVLNIKKSIDLIMNSGIDYEFRTTIVKDELELNDLTQTANLIKGARLYVLQKFVPSKVYDKKFLTKISYSDAAFETIKDKLENYVKEVLIR